MHASLLATPSNGIVFEQGVRRAVLTTQSQVWGGATGWLWLRRAGTSVTVSTSSAVDHMATWAPGACRRPRIVLIGLAVRTISRALTTGNLRKGGHRLACALTHSTSGASRARGSLSFDDGAGAPFAGHGRAVPDGA